MMLYPEREMLLPLLWLDLAGWQLDKLAESQNNRVNDDDSGSDSSDEEDVPFACLICRKPYTDPVVTRCSHYFCSACAIKRFAKTPKCLACGAPTGGIFNRADKIIEKMNKKRQEKEEREAEGSEEGSSHIQIEGLNENRNENGQGDDSDTSD
jgi:RING finger protein 113A